MIWTQDVPYTKWYDIDITIIIMKCKIKGEPMDLFFNVPNWNHFEK